MKMISKLNYAKDILQKMKKLPIFDDDNRKHIDIISDGINEAISELEATQSLRVKITKLNPTYGVSDGYMDGYYAAISDVEKILSPGEEK